MRLRVSKRTKIEVGVKRRGKIEAREIMLRVRRKIRTKEANRKRVWEEK